MFFPSRLYRSDGQWRLFQLLLSSEHRLRTFLLLMFLAGLILFLPNRYTLGFQPRSLIFVIFPAFTVFFAWLYVKVVARGFSLIDRHISAINLEGETVTVTLTIGYKGPVPFCGAVLIEDFPAADILESPEVVLRYGDFRKNRIAAVSYRNLLNRGYGRFDIGPAFIRVSDPFGFFERRIVFAKKTPIEVWLHPPTPDDLDLIKENALTPMGDSRSTQSGHGMDFYGIKEYVHGDDVRAISWLKTAQTGRPVIKQFERDTRPDVLVAVHTDKKQLRGFGFGNTMKRLLRLAAAVLCETRSQGLPAAMAVCMGEDPHYIRLSSNLPVYGFLTELLADIKPAEEGSLQQLVSLTMQKAGPGSIVIFLSQTIHLDMEMLLGAMLNLQARGARVSLWVIDDSNMVRFSEEQQNSISKEDFKNRLEEMDIELILIPAKRDNPQAL